MKDKKKTKTEIAKEMGISRRQYHNVKTTWPIFYDAKGVEYYVSPNSFHKKLY
jgi:uncharacterized membrane protein